MRLVPGDLDDPRVVALLEAHTNAARAQTAPGSSHALSLNDLRASNVGFWTIWENDALLGSGALKRLSTELGEIKSMYTAPFARRRGVAGAMLRHIIAAGRAADLARLCLETGSWPYFAAARAFYEGHGFQLCPPFAAYTDDPNSIFMTLDLR